MNKTRPCFCTFRCSPEGCIQMKHWKVISPNGNYVNCLWLEWTWNNERSRCQRFMNSLDDKFHEITLHLQHFQHQLLTWTLNRTFWFQCIILEEISQQNFYHLSTILTFSSRIHNLISFFLKKKNPFNSFKRG